MQMIIASYYAPIDASRFENGGAFEQFKSKTDPGVQMDYIVIKIMMLNEQIKEFRKDEKGVTMLEYGIIGDSHRCGQHRYHFAQLAPSLRAHFTTIKAAIGA